MKNILSVNKKTSVYVACPANETTGGPELLHQLVFELNKLNIQSYMYYYDRKRDISPVSKAYTQYGNPYIEKIEDDQNNILIVPEIMSGIEILIKYQNIKKVMWWLSVDNHFDLDKYIYSKHHFFIQRLINKIIGKKIFNINDLAYKKFKNSKKELPNFLKKQIDFHLYQSFYAKDFLDKNNIHNTKYLADYLNKYFLSIHTEYEKKENIIVYNPKKGYSFTKKIIDESNGLTFVPIINMNRQEVIKLLQKAKVYIDFGNHPGKDRIPREAAILGCCIITNRNGSANFVQDLPINDNYKFNEKNKNIPLILKKIENCILNYDSVVEDFKPYIKTIQSEHEKFIMSIKSIFKSVEDTI